MKQLKDTCILITTFLRDELLFRCIESVRRYYPRVGIYVGDNGRPNDEKRRFCDDHNCEYLPLPFDLGVAGVRNEAMWRIPPEFKFLIVIEDDIVFTEKTKLESWRRIMDAEPDAGIVGGLLINEGGVEQHYEADIRIDGETCFLRTNDRPEWKQLDDIKYTQCGIILNVFMIRRAVLDEVIWDDQFKTAFEHCDFFLSLKYKTKWRVLYTPNVALEHLRKGQSSDEYNQYRMRPKGYVLFARKWKIKLFDSSYNPPKVNPVKLEEIGMNFNEKDEALEKAIRILERHGIKWWLEAGTCLGVIRGQNFIEWDPDIDIGIAPGFIGKWDELKADFQAAGFEFYREWRHKKDLLELSFKFGQLKTDLFFFFECGDRLWHGAFGPVVNEDKTEYTDFLPHVFSKELFTDLKETLFRGKRVFLPNPPEDYLRERYGPDWPTPNPHYAYWLECRAIDRNFFKKSKTVFIGGVWDLFHVGHLNILQRCRRLGTRLIVGVLTDEAARKYKPRPIIPFDQRKRIIEGLGWVDQVIEQHDSNPTEDLQKLKIQPHYLVHGTDWDRCPGDQYVKAFGGKSVFFPYTKEISTSEIKERIANYPTGIELERDSAEEEKIAVCIKTFYREPLLMRTIKALENNFPYYYRIYIADDSKVSDRKEYLYQRLEKEGHVIARLPHDMGISAGRNHIVKMVNEDYLLMMDDDIEITDGKSIKNMKAVLDADPEVGIVAGMLYTPDGFPYANSNYIRGLSYELDRGVLFRRANKNKMRMAGDVIYQYADQVVNFFLARREVFKDVKWDSRIKVEYEHIDFFLELRKTKWKTAVCLETKAVHQNQVNDSIYNEARRSAPRIYFMQKHGFGNIINQF